MNIVQELINQLKTKCKTGSTQEKEKIAVDFLCGIDFSDADIKNQSKKYIGHILNDIVAKNQQLTSLDAKIIHCMVAKISLDSLGLSDVKINYRDRSSYQEEPANYSRRDNSITFFNDFVNDEVFVKPSDNQKYGALSRLFNFFAVKAVTINHEIRHAYQFKHIDESNLTRDGYIISMQELARDLASDAGYKGIKKFLVESSFIDKTKYKDGYEYIGRLYKDNHDQFYDEIDANLYGFEQAEKYCQELSPTTYELMSDPEKSPFIDMKKAAEDKLKNYEKVTWEHNTNVSNKPVQATHKASMIVDYLLPYLSETERKSFFDKYPALNIAYNSNGSLKTLEQVEREEQVKINNLLINGTDEEIQEKAASISKVYDTAIESHPVLCFEKCLQHMARLSWNSDRYFTDSGIEVKYNPSEVRKELRMTQAKAKAIASYMEDTDANQLKAIFDRYKREILKDQKYDQQSLRFFEDKKLALYDIEYNINHNKEVESVIEQDKRKAADERAQAQMKKEQAEETIKKVFPGFTPAPQKGRLENGSVIFSDNTQEKLILMEAYKRYINTITGNDKINKTDKDFVSSDKLLIAIKHLYGFNVPIEEYREFYAKLKNNEIDILQNKYEQKEKQAATEKASGAYTEDDTKDYIGQTFHMKAKTPNAPKPERKSHPEDPESDAAKAMFQSQRRVASEQYREMMEENAQTEQREVRPVTEEELEAIKQQHPELDTAKREEELRQQEIARQRAEHKKQQEEDSYGVAMKRNSDSGQNVRQRTQQNMGFSR